MFEIVLYVFGAIVWSGNRHEAEDEAEHSLHKYISTNFNQMFMLNLTDTDFYSAQKLLSESH